MAADMERQLLACLRDMAKQMVGQNMLGSLVRKAQHWLEEQSARDGQQAVSGGPTGDTKVQRHAKKSSKSKKATCAEQPGKLPSMKTAQDVISRIAWDDALPADCFSIGYLDRFLGVIVKPFSTFTWDDIAGVDYDAVAIPQHRIQYFLYKDVKVWDKNERLDNVFGSTGSCRTISNIIAQYESKNEPDANIAQAQINDSQCLEIRGLHRKGNTRPNYFVAVRINNADIIQSVQEVQKALTDRVPSYAAFLTPVEKLHLTVCCLGLDTSDQVENAARAIGQLKRDLQTWDPLDIEVKDVQHFAHRVLYAAVETNEKFNNFALCVRSCLRRTHRDQRSRRVYTTYHSNEAYFTC